MLSPAVENLVTQLTRLPGIGRRTAQRLAFHLLSAQPEDALELAHAIEDVKARVRFCRECGNLTEEELCGVCSDERRDRTVICVVEQPVDVVSVERTGEFRGLYHVLGGALSPLDGVEPVRPAHRRAAQRVERNGVTEVVLATNPNMTGEATAAYVADRLRGQGAGHAARERAPGRRRPRVRRRGHARPGARRPPRDVATHVFHAICIYPGCAGPLALGEAPFIELQPTEPAGLRVSRFSVSRRVLRATPVTFVHLADAGE